MSKRKVKAKLYASIINGKVVTGYNKDLLAIELKKAIIKDSIKNNK
jgi:hypothetical protein